MKRNMFLGLAVAGSMLAAGLAQEMPRGMAQMGERSAQMDAVSSDADLAFAAVAISDVRLSREISEYVATKATDPAIKKLAQDIATEQNELSQKVQAAATKEGITLHPDQLLPRDQAVLDFVKELPVPALERTYVFQLAGANQTHLLMAQWAAKNARKPEIRQAAQELASVMEKRSVSIRQLAQAQMNRGGRTASETP